MSFPLEFNRPIITEITQKTIKELSDLVKRRDSIKTNPEQQQLLDEYDRAKNFSEGLKDQFPDFYNTFSRMIDMVLNEESALAIPIINDPIMFICWQPLFLVRSVERELQKQQNN